MFTVLDLINIFLPLFILLSFALHPYEAQEYSLHFYSTFGIAILQSVGEFLYPFEYHLSDYCIAISHVLCWIIIMYLLYARPLKYAFSGVTSLLFQQILNTFMEWNPTYPHSSLFRYRALLIFGQLLCICMMYHSLSKRHIHVYDGVPEASRELHATLWQSLTFSWFNDLIKKGYYKYLSLEDVWNLTPQDSSQVNFDKLQKIRQTYPDNLRDSLILLVRPVLIQQAFFALVSALLSFSGPFFLNLIVKFVENPVIDSNYCYAFALGLFVCSMSRAIADGQTYFLGRRIGTKVRAAIIAELYAKSLKRVSNASSGSLSVDDEMNAASSGEILNLMSVDTQKILEVSCYLMYTWTTPLQICLCIGFLVYVLGWPALAGIFIMVLMVPVGGSMGKFIAKKQKLLMKSTDKRINYTNELLQGIRLIKFYAWETNFLSRLDQQREKELEKLWEYIKTIALNKVIWYATPIFVSFLTFGSLTFLAGEELTASKAFTGLALFNSLQHPLRIFPDIIVRIEEALVSIKRVSEFLAEVDLETSTTNQTGSDSNQDKIGFLTKSTFAYHQTDLSCPKFLLQDIQIEFPHRQLTVIAGKSLNRGIFNFKGPTGAGKTSLLMALLGEMKCLSGGGVLKTAYKNVGYVSQQVWLTNATIRDNILFGKELDISRYERVIYVCALNQDLLNLSAGDLTEVGEGGINLSGGQKARISLARAVYSDASCIVMDDPLSAVDSPTARFLFEQCICGPLMKDKTRILVTHSVSLCVPMSDYVVFMKSGRVLKQGPRNAFQDDEVCGMAFLERGSSESTAADSSVSSLPATTERLSKGSLIQEESRESGSVDSKVYLSYSKAAGGPFFIFLVLGIFTAAQLIVVGNDWWLKSWATSSKKQENSSESSTALYYLTVYGAIGLLTIFILFGRILLVATGSIRASRKLHHALLRRIVSAPVRFFEITPIGRILNRFSKDMKDIDQEVATFSADFLANCISALVTLTIIIFVSPYVLLGIFPIGIGYFFIAKKYLRTSRELKRLEAVTRSPIFSHFGEALQGAQIIRAYNAQSRFMDENHIKVDLNHRPFFYLWVSNRWLSIRIEFIGSLVAFCTALSVILLTQLQFKIDAGLAGLSLSYSLAFTEALLWLVRFHALMEMEMNAVERVLEYMEIDQEPPSVVDEYRPTDTWPSDGRIEVKNLTLRYNPSSPLVLDHVSFSVDPCQKLAIVGRTGAGKTSLTLAFFRFLEPEEGEIIIDGFNIFKMGLFDLRNGLTVIPQQPTLFMGTVRSNLDPFGQYSDHDMFIALKRSHLLDTTIKSRQSSADNIFLDPGVTMSSQITLDTTIEESGGNFSHGQRQLLCLARAILKRSKIIILDEATASVDHDTDAKIQRTIREEFKGSVILTIAHRLRTVMDYDRILVLNKGAVAEFGCPLKLAKSNGIFRKMCDESGEYDELLRIAGAT